MSTQPQWPTVALNTVADFLSGGTPSKARPDYWRGDIPWISAKDMKQARIRDSEDHISPEGLADGSRIAPKGATLVLVRGMTLISDVPICVVERDAAFNQDVKAIVARSGINPAFLNYSLLAAKPLLLSYVEFAGHGTGRLPTDRLQALQIPIPAAPEQTAIAQVLSALDDKIELNRRMNETLEAMARSIFKSWFVDFDPVRANMSASAKSLPMKHRDLFPCSFQDSEFGTIPKGWFPKSLSDVCCRIAMGPFGSDIKTDNFVESGVPVIRGGNLADGFVDSDFVFVSEHKADELRNANAFPEDIVITHRGTLGQVGLIPSRSNFPRYVVSQSQMLLSLDRRIATPRFVFEYLRSPLGQHRLLANTSQTGVPAIARPVTSVKAIRFVLPPLAVLQAFEEIIFPLVERVNANVAEVLGLTAVRDALLPKLISGAIRVAPFQPMELATS